MSFKQRHENYSFKDCKYLFKLIKIDITSILNHDKTVIQQQKQTDKSKNYFQFSYF